MASLPTIARASQGGAILSVYVQPNSSRTECVGIHDDAVKIRVAARPIDGAANEELIRFVAEQCAVPRANVQLQMGATGRHKRLAVKGITAESLLARLTRKESKGRGKI